MYTYPVFNKKRPFKKLSRALIVLPFFVIAACGGSDDDETPPPSGDTEFSQSTVLVANVAEIMRAGYADLNTSVSALNTSVIAYCNTVTDTDVGNSALHTTAQTAFNAAMSDVQHSIMHGFGTQGQGPALSISRGMQVLYSWPLTNSCQIDTRLADDNPLANVATAAANLRGMDALEYLLYSSPGDSHSCSTSTAPLNAFNALPDAQKQLRRCNYMKNVAADAVVTAETLADAWDPAIGNYVATMTATTNVKTTLNKVTDAMYYLREDLREFKLGRPLNGNVGARPTSCDNTIGGNVCPQDVESFYAPNSGARISSDNIRANVLSFRQLYRGGDDGTASVGFDDWLVEVGKPDVATQFTAEIEDVLSKLDVIDATGVSLYAAIGGSDVGSVNNLLTAVDIASQTLRNDVIPAMGLSIPAGLVSDTD